MTALPRDPDRFATKDDLAALGSGLDAQIAMLEANLPGEIKSANSELLRTLFFASQAAVIAAMGSCSASPTDALSVDDQPARAASRASRIR